MPFGRSAQSQDPGKEERDYGGALLLWDAASLAFCPLLDFVKIIFQTTVCTPCHKKRMAKTWNGWLKI